MATNVPASSAAARSTGSPVFWRVQIVGWGLFALVDLIDEQLTYNDIPIALFQTVLVYPALVLISTALRAVYASPSFDNRLSQRAVAPIALCSLLGAAVVVALLFVAQHVSGWTIPTWDSLQEIVIPLIHYSLALVGWSLGYFWIHAEIGKRSEHRHATAAEAEALRAELEELRLQLDPHFLFNALNGVAEEIPEHPAAALAMLRDLTAYLRHSLDGINQTVVTVEAEVGGLAAYLRVQKARFGDRLKTRLHTDPDAVSRRIASFLLQPLVENAVKHGRRDNGLDVSVDVRLTGDALHIEIENTGTLENGTKSRLRRSGIGLENVRRRLALHYPGRHQFTIGDRVGEEGKVVAMLVLEGEPCSGS